jgi:hypothetical protein
MVKTRDSICPHCASTGSKWDGSEYVECTHCDGTDRSEQFDSIIDLDDWNEDDMLDDSDFEFLNDKD